MSKAKASKLPNLPPVDEQEPVISKSKGVKPAASKPAASKPAEKKPEVKKEITLITRVHELLDGRDMTDEEIAEKVDAEFSERKLSIAGYRGNINFARLKKDPKYDILVQLVRDENGTLALKVKGAKKAPREDTAAKINLALAKLPEGKKPVLIKKAVKK